ncbi:NADP-dependent oxidoreductase [Streptomyces cavernicola]|uniref:NADP-dependent oxidoreductase n=1 Tax=Streptomyces cavernicola TaxID=3043613 RepID=A0ABT6SBX5_9ACTN|nr:NADP-dependent oxidoreductase [Streptomyces sp. B-S-A6]MDI3405696.1 NADP-dependent oxidoreductase [Streptomyces sp. B-S-A6]
MPKAAIYREYGDSSVLTIADVPMPEPGPGMVRVRVEYAAVNPVDSKMRSGVLGDGSPLAAPAIAGMDVAGVVDAVGEHVDGLRPGDRVAGLSPSGAAAEYVVTYAAALVQVPEHVSSLVAATIGVGGSTAVRALGLAEVTKGQLILVDGAAGGVGTFLTQLARARGVQVVGTASRHNHAHLTTLGATPIEYGSGAEWERAALEAAAGGLYDAAFDLVTGGKYDVFRRITTPDAPVVTLVDPEVPARGGILVTGLEPSFDHALQEVMDAIADGELDVPIAEVFPLAEIAAAQDLSAEGHVRGKLVLAVAAP